MSGFRLNLREGRVTPWQGLRHRVRRDGVLTELRHLVLYGPTLYKWGRKLGLSRWDSFTAVLLP